MLTVITYDVSTADAAGRRRLRKVAKYCVNYGQRVQNSVFECSADAAKMVQIKEDLIKMIDVALNARMIQRDFLHYELVRASGDQCLRVEVCTELKADFGVL